MVNVTLSAVNCCSGFQNPEWQLANDVFLFQSSSVVSFELTVVQLPVSTDLPSTECGVVSVPVSIDVQNHQSNRSHGSD